ncbi:transketolase [Chloroflexota bacterium]
MITHEHSPELQEELRKIALALRIDALNMIHRRGQGHPGGALSAAEIMAALYFHHLRIKPEAPDWENRDRFILSKGHASAILYPALARRGYFPFEDLKTWGEIGSHLQGHPDRLKTPGVDMSSGCLGHGISIGAGLCFSAGINGLDFRTYVMIGDGECQAGIIWEGVMLAAKYKLSNLITILDYNKVQLDGRIDEIMPLEPMKEKWASFNWNIIEIDGHNMKEVLDSLDEACSSVDGPTIIIAQTVKGKGVSFMEGKAEWHYRVPSADELKLAMEELNVNV